jgi:hypothetical protein
MDRFEYAAGLFSVIVGLGLADLGVSAHRMMKHRSQVRWDPLALATVAYVVLLLISIWYDLWGLRPFPDITGFTFYVCLLGQLFLLFLLASASLPDEPSDGYDLFAYYDREQRYIWSLLLAFQIAFAALWLYFMLTLDSPILPRLHQVAVPLIGTVILLLVRRRAVQIPLLVVLFGFKAVDYVGTSL